MAVQHNTSQRYNLRSNEGQQSSPTDLTGRIQGATATLDALTPVLEGLTPSNAFETGMVNYMRIVTAQLREIKLEQGKLRDEFYFRNRAVSETIDDLHLSVVKGEQYSRRDTVTVVGLAKPDAESQADLCAKVAAVLTQSGETVSVTDLSAVHRNSKDGKLIRGKTVPPSVTVRFCTVNKKDNILKRYRNYDSAKKAESNST